MADIINANYAKYRSLADVYRKKGRNAIADALERQAQRELEKPAMDINDINLGGDTLRDAYNNPNAIVVGRNPETPSVDSEALRDKYNNPNETVAPVANQPQALKPVNTADENYNVGYNLGAMVGNAVNQNKGDNPSGVTTDANGDKDITGAVNSAINEFMSDPEAQTNMAGSNYYEPDLSVPEQPTPTIQNADYADRVGSGYYDLDTGIAPAATIQNEDYADRWAANNKLRNAGYSTQGNITMPNGNVLPQEDEKKRKQQELMGLLAKGYPDILPY